MPQTLQEIPGEARTRAAEQPARWPERIVELAVAWRSARRPEERERPRAELWVVVNLALQRYARASARRLGALAAEDVRDIAADKALELLGRLDGGRWDPAASSPGEVCAFLASVARHGVVDWLRGRRRELRPPAGADEPAAWASDRAGIGTATPPSLDAESAEHARAIAECAKCLTPRARRAWLLRVFHDFPSTDIARHPAVASTPAAVDAMLMRCRRIMRDCMLEKGFDPGALPPGTFATLWELVWTERPSTPSGSRGECRR